MTTDQPEPLSESEMRAVSAKLSTWARTLSTREQRCLAALLMPGNEVEPGEVEGFAVPNMRHEMLKAIASNLRG